MPTSAGRNGWWCALLAITTVLLASGCGSACPQISKERTDFFARRLSKPVLHASLDLPFDEVNRLFAAQLKGMAPVPVDLPGLAAYRKQLGSVAIAPRSVRLKPGKPGALHFDLDFAVLRGKRVLFTLATTAEVSPTIADGTLQIPITPASLRSVRPTLGPGATRQLGDFLYDLVPGPAKLVASKRTLRKAARRALREIVDGGYALLRDSVVAEMAPRTRIAIDLPDLPIDDVNIQSRQGWLALGLKTRMPVEGRLPRTLKAPPKGRLRVRMLGGAVAELGNRAIESGDLPQRLSEKGKPAKNGAYRPGLSWASGERPAKIWLWKEQDQCMRARVGGTPQLSARKTRARQSEVQVRVADGAIEDVEGSTLLAMGAWVQSLWADAISLSKSVVAETKFEVADRKITVAVERARVLKDVVELELSARHR